MKKTLQTLHKFFSLIPGVAILTTGLGVPPGENNRLLFGGIIETIGVLSLYILWVNRQKIGKISKSRITKCAISLGILFLVLLILYLIIYNLCVVSLDLRGTVYFPILTKSEVYEMIEIAGSRKAAVNEFGRYAVYNAIQKMNDLYLEITTILLLIIYLTVFTSITIAFGLLGISESNSELQIKKIEIKGTI